MNTAFRKNGPRKRAIVANSYRSAADTIGPMEPGIEIFGLTRGQFSFIDILEHVVSEIGKCNIVIATWTAGNADIRKAEKFLKNGNVESMQWIVDRSFKKRKPELCELISNTFGQEAIRTARCHAKFMLAWNEEWKIVLRTSMNLNQNPRIENFEISDDPEFLNFMRTLAEEMFETNAANGNFSTAQQGELFKINFPETATLRENEEKLCLNTSPIRF